MQFWFFFKSLKTYFFNPLKYGRFLDRYFKVLWGGGRDIRSKRFARPRIFRYGLSHDILSKRQRKREWGAYSAPPCFKGKFNLLKGTWNVRYECAGGSILKFCGWFRAYWSVHIQDSTDLTVGWINGRFKICPSCLVDQYMPALSMAMILMHLLME